MFYRIVQSRVVLNCFFSIVVRGTVDSLTFLYYFVQLFTLLQSNRKVNQINLRATRQYLQRLRTKTQSKSTQRLLVLLTITRNILFEAKIQSSTSGNNRSTTTRAKTNTYTRVRGRTIRTRGLQKTRIQLLYGQVDIKGLVYRILSTTKYNSRTTIGGIGRYYYREYKYYRREWYYPCRYVERYSAYITLPLGTSTQEQRLGISIQSPRLGRGI